jgi:prepilin-type N-terminal cleavage/methylation domain-containing protein
MKRAGFTLIELMTVVAIIGLLAMIAIPKLTNLKGRAQVAAMKSDLRNLVTLEENYFAQNLKYATATDLAGTYTVSAGNSMPTVTLTGDGWTGTISSGSAGQLCAVFMGSTPARPATKEGAPACAESGSGTVTQ